MGLDTSHNAWHGAYSAFNRWRSQLAEVAGYPNPSDDYGLDWAAFKDENLYGRWGHVVLPDALQYLLVHSDCDGELMPEHAALVADRLTELVPLLPDGSGGGHIRDWREVTQQFIDGCRAAAAEDKPIVFA